MSQELFQRYSFAHTGFMALGTNCQITKESDTSLLLTNTAPLRENEANTIAVSM